MRKKTTESLGKHPLRTLFLVVVLGAALCLYYVADPAQSLFFPRCPFLMLTGLECPGCGSQRAVHALLHLHLGDAFRANALLFVLLPYLFAGLWFEYFGGKIRFARAHQTLFGGRMIWVMLLLIVGFTVLRNLL